MKSLVSDYLELVRCIYEDACTKCTTDVSDLRDLKTIKSRAEQEGMSFLTITLPSFAKDFEKSLANGFVDPADFRSFRKCGAIPAFLRGMLGYVFSKSTGRILDHVDDHSILVEAVRQVCNVFKKIEMPYTPLRARAAINNFVEVERELSVFALDPAERDKYLSVADCLWHNALAGIQPANVVPKHGPGATAEHISGNQKFAWRHWYERLEYVFPFLENAYSVSASGEKPLQLVTFVPVGKERSVRVVLVPKTLKAPRIIAVEPVCMQYAQQAVQAALYESLEDYWLSKGHVNFTDQSINRNLAVIASRDGSLATIDLSDASDRVPYSLALDLYRTNPDLRDLVDSCRSTSAKLPDGREISPLSKFASMGSALCFPTEAMYFYTICVKALLEKRNLPVTPRNIFLVSRDVYVYGDDLIVPVNDVEAVLDHLQKYNCKVNMHKSFWTGKFRESCGMDAYAGEQVTPVYVRRVRPKSRQQASEIVSWVATANLFYLKGYWRTASLMWKTCEKYIGALPYVSPYESGLGRISFLGYRTISRWDDDTQSFLTDCYRPSPVYRSDRIDGYPALQKCLLKLHYQKGNAVDADAYEFILKRSKVEITFEVQDDHLVRTARYGTVALKRHGVPATIGRGLEA